MKDKIDRRFIDTLTELSKGPAKIDGDIAALFVNRRSPLASPCADNSGRHEITAAGVEWLEASSPK
jgi:hypothetical protein